MIKLLLLYSVIQSALDKRFLGMSIFKSLLLAAFTWWLCGFSMWLWNRRFRLRLSHHLLCAVAAVVTLATIFIFQCLGEVQNNALRDLKRWQSDYLADRSFDWLTFVRVSESLQQLYRQNGWSWDSEKYIYPPHEAPPDSEKYAVPLDRKEAQDISLKIYCDRTVEHLTNELPVLSGILLHGAQVPTDSLRSDLASFQRTNESGVYDFTRGSLSIAGDFCLKQLGNEVSREILILRLWLVAIFMIVQLAAFGLAGHAAYSDLKMTR